MAEPLLRMLVYGCQNPPETFLDRLFCGLEARGVEVTLASSGAPRPTEMGQRKHWIWAPHAVGGKITQGIKLAAVASAAAGRSWTDAARVVRGASGVGTAAAIEWMRALPLVGRAFDVVYFPWIESAGGLIRHFPAEQKIIVSCRGSQINIAQLNPQRRRFQESLIPIFKRAACVHCVSEDIKENAERLGMPPHVARVIRPAVDSAQFSVQTHRERVDDSVLRIVTTCRVVWNKGLEYLVHAVAKLRASGIDARLEIIGDGDDRERVLYTADDLEIEDYVQLSGVLPPTQVRDRLQQADVFVLSSLSEGFCNAVLEAMSCGLPIVTTDCGGVREAVTDGVEGFLTPTRDPQAIATALGKLASNAALRHSMGAAARLRIEREFTFPGHIDAWLSMLTEVAARKSHVSS